MRDRIEIVHTEQYGAFLQHVFPVIKMLLTVSQAQHYIHFSHRKQYSMDSHTPTCTKCVFRLTGEAAAPERQQHCEQGQSTAVGHTKQAAP
jgi:hypothetical protein